ncbi:MAG: putative membrane protein [Gammaproteobacteria bacterium]
MKIINLNVKVSVWIIIFVAVLTWSGINPHDYPTWILEVVPALAGFLILGFTYQRFPLTGILYILILIHCLILMVGGHYTYAEVPLFDSFAEFFNSERNNYDKLGHFAQGFVPAMITREILLRLSVVKSRKWMNFIIICICLAISAFYELIEWFVALMSDSAAESFLGTQGYIWDTQSDMAWALTGAIIALLILTRMHDRQLSKFLTRP